MICEFCRTKIDTDEFWELHGHPDRQDPRVYIAHKQCKSGFGRDVVIATTDTLQLVRVLDEEEE
jgi:hypothetical protein